MNTPRDLDPSAARARGLLARSELGQAARSMASRRIASQLGRLAELTNTGTVAGYWPTAAEVDLTDLWHDLAAMGTQVNLPVIDPGGAPSMRFVGWEPDTEMVANRFGIPEPVGFTTPLESIDVIVLPCSAIDDQGTRVGMGAGFYDRMLGDAGPRHSGPLLVAVAFEAQRVAPGERIVRRHWDIPVDVVVTEEVLLRTGGHAPGG